MNTNLKKHTFYYFVLLLILSVGMYITLQTSYDRNFQVLLLIVLVSFYVLWGIIHHLAKHDFCFKIVVEYILVGLLGFMAALFFLRG